LWVFGSGGGAAAARPRSRCARIVSPFGQAARGGQDKSGAAPRSKPCIFGLQAGAKMLRFVAFGIIYGTPRLRRRAQVQTHARNRSAAPLRRPPPASFCDTSTACRKPNAFLVAPSRHGCAVAGKAKPKAATAGAATARLFLIRKNALTRVFEVDAVQAETLIAAARIA